MGAAAGVHGIACVPWPDAGEPIEPAPVQPGDTLAILYTSGTSGPAKGVLCPHAQYLWWGLNSARILGVHADDVLCTTLPLFHINALNTYAQAALMGARAVFETKFSASGFWPAMCRHEATVVYLLGAMVPILLAQPAGEAERAHCVRIGLGPGVPATAGAAFHARTGVVLLEGYGSTETNFVIATAVDSPRRGVMGWVQPGFEARVVDEQDVEVPADTAGELVLRAAEPFAFSTGYFGMPDKTLEAWRNRGSTPATAWCAKRTGRFGLSIASRTRSAAAVKTSRRTRSSRCCSAIRRWPKSRSTRCVPNSPRTR